MAVTSFQAILDKALADYREHIGVEIDKHPFADELRGSDSPDDVLKLLEDKANVFRVYRDGNRKLIKWLSPVVQVVHTLSRVLGEAVPFQPAKALFVGVDVLITAADGVSSSYDSLVDLFECIGSFLKRLRIYTDIPLTPSMMDIIVTIMVELLSVFALATKQIRQGRFKKFAKKLLGESEIEAVLQRLDRLTQEEGRMTVAQTLEVVHGLVNNVKTVMNDGKASMDSIRKALDAMQQMASEINKMRRDQLQKDSKSWLCPPDPSKNYNIGCQVLRDGTATWFFRESIFAEWNAKGSLLWIYGKPGSGKSILLSSIIREIDNRCKMGLASMAYFYFDFRESEKRHRRGLLSSLIFQLSAGSDPCYQTLSRLYSDHAGGTREPSEDSLSQCLVEMLKVPGQPAMYIIIDALDECPNLSGMPTAREQVLEFLEDLVKLNLPNVYICVSSRAEIDIRHTLEPLEPFCMSLHDEVGQKADISSYINTVVRSDRKMRRWREEDRQLVIDTLSDKADGMFRWVYCQLEILRRTLPAHIRSALDVMPKTLDETYEHALLEIDEEMRQYAQRLFQCLAISFRPLRAEELAEILAVQFDDTGALPKFNPDWRLGDAEEAVLSACSNLISVVNVNGSRIVQFSHFSVKEFLTSDRLAAAREDLSGYYIIPRSAHTILAQASLSVLLQLNDHIDRDSITSFPLSRYAAQYWVDHGKFENVSSTIQVAMEHLFNPDRPHFSIWVWIYDIDDPWRGDMPRARPGQPQAAPLYYAVLCGFRSLIEHLIITYPRDIDTRGGHYTSPLFAALIKEDIDTALSLLQHGADVNILDQDDLSPLHQASQSGRLDIARLLLEHNADINLPNSLGQTPLELASGHGELEVSRLLLQRGADVNSRNNDGQSPLRITSPNGHLEVVRLLIDGGADVNSCDKDSWTSLHLASQEGHVGIVELLLRHDAAVDPRGEDSRTPLCLASHLGHVEVAEVLVQHGAQVNSRDNDGWTPLRYASQLGHVKVAELLIHHRARVDSCDNEGWTPLHLASYQGYVDVTELLIHHGARVDSQTNHGWTPLHSAACNGQLDIVKLLLERGADLNTQDDNDERPSDIAFKNGKLETAHFLCGRMGGATSLDDMMVPFPSPIEPQIMRPRPVEQHPEQPSWQRGEEVNFSDNEEPAVYIASESGQLDIVRSLLDRGFDVNERTSDRKTALDAAARNGKLEVLKLLIERGADVNPRDKAGSTPLFDALRYGHSDVVRMLLDHGADVNAKKRNGWTALHIASFNGYFEMAQLLLERGANVHVRNVDGRTPRQEAIARGCPMVAELLSEHGACET